MSNHSTSKASLCRFPIGIDVVVGPDLLAAVLLDLCFAGTATATASDYAPDSDHITGLEFGDLGTNLNHFSHNLMPMG